MIRLYKDPKGENVFDAHRSTGTSVTPGDLHGIHTLKTRVKELENKLSTMGIVSIIAILVYSVKVLPQSKCIYPDIIHYRIVSPNNKKILANKVPQTLLIL